MRDRNRQRHRRLDAHTCRVMRRRRLQALARPSAHCGGIPISYTLDAIGPLARTVADCAMADGVIAGEPFRPIEPVLIADLRLGIPQGSVLRNLDDTVAARFAAATDSLRKARVRLTDTPMQFDRDIGGPMARTVADAVAVFDVIAGTDSADPVAPR